MGFMLKPPMLTGNVQQDLRAQREYLFKLASSLDGAVNPPAFAPAAVGTSGSTAGSKAVTDQKAMKAVQKSAQELRSLIIKTADNITTYVDDKEGYYNNIYLAQSVFGTFRQEVTEINAETHEYLEQIDSELLQYQKMVNGQILRGFIPDPDNNGEKVLGIAIAQNLSIDATQTEDDGTYTYYRLVTQNFGLYTASGWQFWINGRKAGWFDANGDGILHVRKVVAEDFFQIGGKWQMKVKDGGAELEFVYIGENA